MNPTPSSLPNKSHSKISEHLSSITIIIIVLGTLSCVAITLILWYFCSYHRKSKSCSSIEESTTERKKLKWTLQQVYKAPAPPSPTYDLVFFSILQHPPKPLIPSTRKCSRADESTVFEDGYSYTTHYSYPRKLSTANCDGDNLILMSLARQREEDRAGYYRIPTRMTVLPAHSGSSSNVSTFVPTQSGDNLQNEEAVIMHRMSVASYQVW
ncbi:hypothetical protein BDF14DRAFT_1750817 [Spinellus fusiger]|nr:hypothetical protein BDF14DRAFT_1750817 [Spinellus fusiger]